MLSILGVGFAYPPVMIDNHFLAELQPGLDSDRIVSQTGVNSRTSSLPLDYLRATGNADVSQAIRAALESPTQLGVRAARMAMKRSGIEASDLGLILADCSTPYEITPGEACRIGKELGARIPAYDVASPGVALVTHLDLLAGFRSERLPRYALCVFTNTATQAVDYSRSAEDNEARFYYGDAASALVLSSQEKGRLVVVDSFATTAAEKSGLLKMPCYGHLSSNVSFAKDTLEPYVYELASKAIQRNELSVFDLKFIGPQSYPALLERLASNLGIAPHNNWHNVRRCGDSLSAGPGAVLAENWDVLKSGDHILIALAGPGLGFGYVVLKVGEGKRA